jgi:hypothetical protein
VRWRAELQPEDHRLEHGKPSLTVQRAERDWTTDAHERSSGEGWINMAAFTGGAITAPGLAIGYALVFTDDTTGALIVGYLVAGRVAGPGGPLTAPVTVTIDVTDTTPPLSATTAPAHSDGPTTNRSAASRPTDHARSAEASHRSETNRSHHVSGSQA